MADDILTRLRRSYAFLRDQGHFITANACLAAIHEIQNLRAPTDGADANGWRPIETAPSDGSLILTYGGRRILSRAPMGVGISEADGEWWRSDGCPKASAPTHWMPMPEPPAPALINPPSQEDRDAVDLS